MKKRVHSIKPSKTTQSPYRRKSCAGISVVEVLVALILFAIFMAGASKLLLSNRAIADTTREHYTAVNIAKNRIELARTFPYSSLLEFEENKVYVDLSGEPISGRIARYRQAALVVG